jgi:acyl-CoA reductase-like NAD-dependent aldehyde dehydrogenase
VNSFSFAGQSCISTQRIYLQKWIADDFMERFIPKVEELVVGDPTEEATDVGPVVDDGARDRIIEWIDEATKGGATILTGGSVLEGRLIKPTVLGNVDLGMKVCREEVFGPVVTVDSYETLDDAILLANGTRYGLQAGIFTDSLPSALRAAQRLRFGGVTVNEAPTFRADQMPYGGVKDSGNTREGPAYTVRELSEERVVVVDL